MPSNILDTSIFNIIIVMPSNILNTSILNTLDTSIFNDIIYLYMVHSTIYIMSSIMSMHNLLPFHPKPMKYFQHNIIQQWNLAELCYVVYIGSEPQLGGKKHQMRHNWVSYKSTNIRVDKKKALARSESYPDSEGFLFK